MATGGQTWTWGKSSFTSQQWWTTSPLSKLRAQGSPSLFSLSTLRRNILLSRALWPYLKIDGEAVPFQKPRMPTYSAKCIISNDEIKLTFQRRLTFQVHWCSVWKSPIKSLSYATDSLSVSFNTRITNLVIYCKRQQETHSDQHLSPLFLKR